MKAHPANRDQVQSSLKLKATMFLGLVILAVSTTLSWYFLRQTEGVLTAELQRRTLALTKNLAYNSRYGIPVSYTHLRAHETLR